MFCILVELDLLTAQFVGIEVIRVGECHEAQSSLVLSLFSDAQDP